MILQQHAFLFIDLIDIYIRQAIQPIDNYHFSRPGWYFS